MRPLYFVLGCLDEYCGRLVVENGDRIERFYANERAVADVFLTQISQLAAEYQVTLRLSPGKAGGLYLREPLKAARLDRLRGRSHRDV